VRCLRCRNAADPHSKSAVSLHLTLDSEVKIQAVQCVVQLSSWNRMSRIHGILLSRHWLVCCLSLIVRFTPELEQETLGASYGVCLGRVAGIAALIGLPFIFLVPCIFFSTPTAVCCLKSCRYDRSVVAISCRGICNCKFCVRIFFLK